MYNIPTIKTKRFVIKKLTLANVNKTYFFWFKDPVITKNIVTSEFVVQGGIKHLKLYVSKKINKKNILFLGIFTKKKIHIGNIKFEPISTKRNTAIFGILIGNKKWRRKGVLKEIFPNICKFLHLYYGILRIELGVDEKNKIAIVAFKRLGFIKSDISECKLVKKERNDKTIYFHKILKNLKK